MNNRFERSNPLDLPNDKLYSFITRLYNQAIALYRYCPDLWIEAVSFHAIDHWEEAERLLQQGLKVMASSVFFTMACCDFYETHGHVNEANAKGFAIEGKVFEDKESGSFIVCGGRFQHYATLHIAMMGGDYEKCLDFAVNYAKAQGIKKVSCTYCIENEKLENALKQRGFAAETSDLITMEIKF